MNNEFYQVQVKSL